MRTAIKAGTFPVIWIYVLFKKNIKRPTGLCRVVQHACHIPCGPPSSPALAEEVGYARWHAHAHARGSARTLHGQGRPPELACPQRHKG